VVVTVHHPILQPSDADWEENLNALRRAAASGTQIWSQLAFTDTAGPNSRQRQTASRARAEIGGERNYRGAVVSSSMIVRGIVGALAWADVEGLRSFSPTRVGEALEYLGIADATEVRETVIELARELDGGPAAIQSLLLSPSCSSSRFGARSS
jgi:hypothetical protein